MEKCDERLQRFSAVSETLEIHRGDTQQSVMKLEEPDGARGYGIETSGNLRPKFSRLKRDPERCKKDIRNQGGQQWVARFVCQLPKADHSCAIGTVEVNTCWYKSAGVPMDLHIFVAKLLVYCWLKFNSVRFSIHRCHRFPTAAWSSPQNRLKGKSEGNSTVHYYIYLEVKSMVSCKKQQNQPMAHGLSVSCQHLCFMAGHLQEGQWSCGILHLSLGQLWVSPDGAMAALFEGAPGNCQTQGECFLFFQE